MFTYFGDYIDPAVFRSLDPRSLQIVEVKGTMCALLTLRHSQNVQDVDACIKAWNALPGASRMIPDGQGDLMGFDTDDISKHWIHKAIVIEWNKSLNGNSSTYFELRYHGLPVTDDSPTQGMMRVVAEPTVVALQLLETPPGRLMQLWGNARDGLLGRMRDFPILFWPS